MIYILVCNMYRSTHIPLIFTWERNIRSCWCKDSNPVEYYNSIWELFKWFYHFFFCVRFTNNSFKIRVFMNKYDNVHLIYINYTKRWGELRQYADFSKHFASYSKKLAAFMTTFFLYGASWVVSVVEFKYVQRKTAQNMI